MTTSTAIEREVKFDVDRDFDPPDLRPLVGRTERLAEQHLRTAYFDTTDWRLLRRGISLRHRSGEDEGAGKWTLKLPDAAGGSALTRTEISVTGPRDTVPPEIIRIVRGLVRRSRLTQVAELDATRRRLVLHDKEGQQAWAELDDDLVTVIGGVNDGLTFRQVELEFTSDDESSVRTVRSVLESLRSSGARSSKRSKLSWAVGDPLAGDLLSRDDRRGTRRRPSKQRVAELVRESIAVDLDLLLERDYKLRVDPAQPASEDIHQARVAARRLRSHLRTFGAVVDPVWSRNTSEELRWAGDLLGRVRDLDVLSDHLWGSLNSPALSRGGEFDLRERLSVERSGAVTELTQAMDQDRWIDLLDRLHAAANTLPVAAEAADAGLGALRPDMRARSAIPALVYGNWRSLRRTVAKAGSDPTDADLHKMRIRAKRLRYAAEVAIPLIGKPAARTATAAERAQTLLGEFHDAVSAEDWLRRQIGDRGIGAEAAFAAGVLSREQQIRQQTLRRAWRSEWKRLRRKKTRSWLRH